VAILLAGLASACGADPPLAAPALAAELGTVALALQTSSGAYRLEGTVVFTRQVAGAAPVRKKLGTDQRDVLVTLPAGTYSGALADDYRLSRVSGALLTPIPRVRIVRVDVGGGAILVKPSETTNVTILVTLDDGETAVFARGTAGIEVSVDDQALTCGGCAEGERCLSPGDDRKLCVKPCTTDADCGEGVRCAAPYSEPLADGGEAPVAFCQRANAPASRF
jgi:hypothetical protein